MRYDGLDFGRREDLPQNTPFTIFVFSYWLRNYVGKNKILASPRINTTTTNNNNPTLLFCAAIVANPIYKRRFGII